MTKERKRFAKEFEKGVIRLVIEQERTIADRTKPRSLSATDVTPDRAVRAEGENAL